HLKIGSRPAKRNVEPGVESLRAIPWIFSWTQNRFMTPAWLGVGYALTCLIEEGDLPLLQTMYQQWPFFRSTLDLIEMVLAKSDLNIAWHYHERLAPESCQQIGHELRTEFLRAREAIRQIIQ